MIGKLLGYLSLIVVVILIVSNPTGSAHFVHNLVTSLVVFAQSAAK